MALWIWYPHVPWQCSWFDFQSANHRWPALLSEEFGIILEIFRCSSKYLVCERSLPDYMCLSETFGTSPGKPCTIQDIWRGQSMKFWGRFLSSKGGTFIWSTEWNPRDQLAQWADDDSEYFHSSQYSYPRCLPLEYTISCHFMPSSSIFCRTHTDIGILAQNLILNPVFTCQSWPCIRYLETYLLWLSFLSTSRVLHY